ncbi:MAG: acyl-CoA dehydrogenase family protein [Myxococcota bacterium]|nr:acyl-CoA dehydrogenase [bacterium]MDP6076413.1 acyl-CoA dehydrogenase family protein [Myxococcota bacterium]MDP6244436.1 acyl-CoA dehydrogenase family protein [Myxococcota bacterium]MDP7074061.1 acyl-CoA dehydrogenase family protein [Myxococcota bacterium]MDP7299226.1 acyl-CoA dehydrogenase family protein [Myxococcota bacterium]
MVAATARMADFDLSPEQRLVRETVRDFAEREILPHVERCEREERYPLELIAKLPALGLLGPMIPAAYGGSFSDVVTYGVICEELARVDWVVASVVSVANSLAGSSISKHGTDAQKERWLPALAKGECLASACLTEPGGGTDLANMQTTAERVDGGWKLSGTKVFISHAAYAGLFFVVASVDRAKRHKGVTAFLVDPASEGITIGAFPMRTLKRDNLAEVHFDGVVVPDENVLGEPGGGFPVLGAALDMGRYSVAARCVGQAQRCLELATGYAGEREAFGQKIGEFQMIQQKIADMVVRTESARALVYRLGRMKDAGIGRASLEASLAKLVASEAATQNALDSIQVHGGYGVSGEYEVGRLLLEAKALEFGEGTSELHRKLIAEYALGLRKQ